MTMAQNWVIIGFLASAIVGMVAMMQRSMSMNGKAMTDVVDGLRHEMHTGLDGQRNETIASFNGLRNEMVARFDSVEGQLSRLASLDREVHALTLKVFGGKPPDIT